MAFVAHRFYYLGSMRHKTTRIVAAYHHHRSSVESSPAADVSAHSQESGRLHRTIGPWRRRASFSSSSSFSSLRHHCGSFQSSRSLASFRNQEQQKVYAAAAICDELSRGTLEPDQPQAPVGRAELRLSWA